jgi:hypothetical protein
MSQGTAAHNPNRRELPDYLGLVGNAMYALTGVLFLGGLWFDWQQPGEIIIPFLAIADEPNANSGLFIAGVVILALGYLISKSGQYVAARRTEEVDQTQEWEVDVTR